MPNIQEGFVNKITRRVHVNVSACSIYVGRQKYLDPWTLKLKQANNIHAARSCYIEECRVSIGIIMSRSEQPPKSIQQNQRVLHRFPAIEWANDEYAQLFSRPNRNPKP